MNISKGILFYFLIIPMIIRFTLMLRQYKKKKKIKEENLKTDSGVLRILNNKTVMF